MRESPPRLFALILMAPASALFPSDTFPSCLKGNITWDISSVYNIVANVASPEDCQELCSADSGCFALTWLSSNSALYPLTCAMFAQISNLTTPCEECVSGTPECKCNIPGECDIVGDNIIDIISKVDSVEKCDLLCSENQMCKFYTYLGEGNHFRHTCYLYSGCEIFATDCEDCTTGKLECDICRFDNTLPDGSCRTCKDPWTQFENQCYMNLNNNALGYNNIDTCRTECSSLGGLLASIHSREENDFIFSLIRPHSPYYGATWIGAYPISDYVWEWDDSTHWDYQNWGEGEGHGAGKCVFLGFDGEPEKWTDGVCESSNSFDCICKREVN